MGEDNHFFGKTHSAESLAKMIENSYMKTATGDKNPFYGKTHSDEQKAKWSTQRSGKTLSEEHKIKIGLASKGRSYTDEMREKAANTRAKNKLIKEQKKLLAIQMQHFYTSTIYADINLTEVEIENLEINEFKYLK